MDYRDKLVVSGGLANSVAGAPAIERNPAFHDAFLAAEARLQDMDDAITRLTQRLGPALRPQGPQNPGQSEKEQEHPVQIVAIVNRLQRQVLYHTGRLHDLIDRLEI